MFFPFTLFVEWCAENYYYYTALLRFKIYCIMKIMMVTNNTIINIGMNKI